MDKRYLDALTVLHPLYDLARLLDQYLEQESWTKKSREEVKDLLKGISKHLRQAKAYEAYTGGDILETIEKACDEALTNLKA